MALKSKLLRFLRDRLFLIILIFVLLKWFLITLILKGNIPFGGDQVPPFDPKLYINFVNFSLFWNLFGFLLYPNFIYYIFGFLVSIIASNSSFTLVVWYLFTSLIQVILFYYIFTQTKDLFNLMNKQILFYAILFFIIYFFFFYFSLDTFKSFLLAILGWIFLAKITFLMIILKLALKGELDFHDYLFFIFVFLLTLGGFPAFIRQTIILVLLLVLSLLIVSHKKEDFIKLAKHGGILLAIMLILAIPYIFQFFIIEEALKERVHWKEISFLPKHLKYSQILDVIRLTSSWITRSVFCPYCKELLSLPTLLIYPLFIFSLLFFIRKENNVKKHILYCIFLLLIFYFFTVSTNPPLGFLYDLLNKLFLKFVGVSLMSVFPPGIINPFIVALYLILIPLTLILIIKHFSRKFSIMVLTIFFVAHFVNAFPILSGKVFCQWFNQSICGFSIPKDYKEIDNVLSKLSFYEHVLLLPITPTYIKTNWGFQGTILTVKQLIHPSTIIYGFAPYAEYYVGEIVEKLGLPFSPKGSAKNINTTSKRYFCHKNNEKKKYIDIVYKLQTTYNLYNYNLIRIEIYPNIQDKIWIGIGDKKGSIGWYLGYKYCYNIKNKTVCYLPIRWNDKLWLYSTYDRRNVASIIFRIFNKSYCDIDINIKSKAYKEIKLNEKLLQLFNVKYIVFDSSIEIYKDKKENLLEYLESSTKLIKKTEFLYIFEGVNETSPVWVVINNKIEKPSLEKTTPTYIKGHYYIRNITKFYLVLPLVYHPTIEKMLVVKVEGGKIQRVTNYLGLLAYEVLPEKEHIAFEIRIKDSTILLYYSTLYTPFIALAFLFLLRRFKVI